MKRDVVLVSALWLLLTAVGELLAIFVDIYPVARSDKGEAIEHAFRVLVYFAVPVFTMVVAVLVYSIVRRHTTEMPEEDGPPLQGRGAAPLAWLGVTAALTLAVMIYPGLVSIPEIFGDEPDPDLIVEVVGVQWAWLISYPQHDITGVNELVLPIDRSVRFEITSRDVLHSFWIPSFLAKIDAVPGRTTTMSLTPTKTGSFQTDPNLRVQCAELCGMAHARMRMPVRIVSENEFDEWIEQAQAAAPSEEPTAVPDAQRFTIIGKEILFDTDEIVVETGQQVAITFDNQDDGIPHNWAFYESEEAADRGAAAIFGSAIEDGPLVQQIVFDPPEPGAYFFRCDVHPATMTGTLIVR